MVPKNELIDALEVISNEIRKLEPEIFKHNKPGAQEQLWSILNGFTYLQMILDQPKLGESK